MKSFSDFKKEYFYNVDNSHTFAIFNKNTNKFLQYYEIVKDNANNKYRIFVIPLSFIRPEVFDSQIDAEEWIKQKDVIISKKVFLSYHLEKIEVEWG